MPAVGLSPRFQRQICGRVVELGGEERVARFFTLRMITDDAKPPPAEIISAVVRLSLLVLLLVESFLHRRVKHIVPALLSRHLPSGLQSAPAVSHTHSP